MKEGPARGSPPGICPLLVDQPDIRARTGADVHYHVNPTLSFRFARTNAGGVLVIGDLHLAEERCRPAYADKLKRRLAGDSLSCQLLALERFALA